VSWRRWVMRSKRGWVIVILAASVVILLGWSAFLMVRSGIGVGWLSRLRRGAVELEGVQWLLGQLDVGWTTPREAAIQWVEHGAALEGEGRYREALRAYEKARDLVPDESLVYLALASAYEALEEPDQALAQLEKAAELTPDDAAVQRHLGRLQCLTGEHELCVKTLEKAVDMEPDDQWGRYWLAVAYQQSAEDGFNEALAQYQEALRIEPGFSKAHLGLGMLYRSQPGQEVLAIEAFRQALDAAVDADDEELAAKARAELATLYYAQDNYSQCIDEWKRVLAANPDDAVAHRRLGLCYAMRGEEGDLEQAVAELEQALARDFRYVDAYYLFLGRYYALEKEDVPRAVWALEQFLRFSDDEALNAEARDWIEQHTE
jgi:tetratricopeptide (TPR) repeat protein